MNSNMFDGYANDYDSWFQENDKVFKSELKLLYKALKDLKLDKVLSIGCGSGLFEAMLKKEYDITITDGIEPSKDMASIAEKRGLNVEISDAESFEFNDEEYDVIYLNGSSSYIPDLKKAYSNIYKGLKKGGHLILLDVPKESAYGILYSFAKEVGEYKEELFSEIAPSLPYPIELVKSGVFHSTPEKEDIVKNELGMKNIKYYQTLIHDPIYTNDQVEDVIEGYGKGGYVALIAEK